jgi:thiopeptide-type bacteriocin biosynthesis protein
MSRRPASTGSASPGSYQPAGFFLLRAPVLPAAVYRSLTGDGSPSPGGDLPARRAETRRRLRELMQLPRVVRAVHVASPSTTAALPYLADEPERSKRSARAYATVLRYLTRMTTRPTPYGLFAGVAMGRLADRTTLALAADPVARTRTRVDTGWLLGAIKAIEAGDLRSRLGTTTNPLLYRAGDRAVLPFADVYGQSDDRHIDIRVTKPVEIALAMAARPGASLDDITEQILAELPTAGAEQARGLVDRLWELNILMSDLRPDTTAALPEEDLLKRLGAIDGAEPLQAALRRSRELAQEVDDAREAAGTEALDRLAAHQRTIAPDYQRESFQLDTALALTGDGLSHEIGAAAAEAAEILTRVGSGRRRAPHIAEYHAAFLERYGVDAEIPVLELLSPELGLDAPTGYTCPPRRFALPMIESDDSQHSRDQVLTAMLIEAMRSGETELELTDDRLARLSVWDPATGPAPRPSLDVYAQVVAESREAIDRGDWQLVIAPGGIADGGRTFGRFFDLLGETALNRLRENARAEEARCPDVDFVELSYLPPYGRGGNVTVHPGLRRFEICVNTSPSVPAENLLALSDILVGATADRFYLRSAASGRELRVTQSHMLTPTSAPNICRLLLELSEDGVAALAGWDWGPAGRAAFLPRVTRGRLVLAPAHWSFATDNLGLPPGDLPEPDAFYAAVQRWRSAWRVPRHVYLAFLDNRLLIDLENPVFVDDLRDQLRRARRGRPSARLVLHEAIPHLDQTWLTDAAGQAHFSEVVVPLLARESSSRPVLSRRPPTTRAAGPPRRRLIGEEWVYLKLYGSPNRHDDILTGPVLALVSLLREAGLIDRWFFLRYADPYPHLRLRFRAVDEAAIAPVLTAAVTQGRDLVRDGLASDLALSSYDREVERYGGPAAIDELERLFEANSDMVVELLTALRDRTVGLDRDVAAVVALAALGRHWGDDPLSPSIPVGTPTASAAARKRFRSVKNVLGGLLVPWADRPDEEALRWRGPLTQIVDRRGNDVTTVAAVVRDLAAADRLIGTPVNILGNLAHMQANRLLGMDHDQERVCHELLALTVNAIRRRPAASRPGE